RLRGRAVRRSRPRAGRRRRGHAQSRRHGRAERDASPLEQSRAGARRACRRDHRSEPLVIRYEAADGIGTITIDRPEKRNAMTYAMLAEFISTVRKAGADDDARVVIVTGADRKSVVEGKKESAAG